MKLNINLGNNSNKEQLIKLKQFIEKAKIDELEDLIIDREENKIGQMGNGKTLNSVTAIIQGNQGALSKLAEAIVKYIEILRADIFIKNELGEELKVSATLNKQAINQLVENFLEKSRKTDGKMDTNKNKLKG